MNRQQRKRLVKDLVSSRQLPQLIAFAQEDMRVIGVLCALLFEQDDRVRWRAIEALGAVARGSGDADLARPSSGSKSDAGSSSSGRSTSPGSRP